MATTIIYSKRFLTSEELSYIVTEMLKHDSAIEQEIVKVGMVAQLVVKDLGEYESCNDIYDYVMEKNIDLTKIVNYDTIDKLVNEERGVNKIISDFVSEFNDKISETLKDLDINKAVEQLKEIAKNREDLINMPKEKFDKKFNSEK